MLTIHTYERNPNYRHRYIQCVKTIPLASAAGSDQKYAWRICIDLIFTIEIDHLFCLPENYVVIANESFATVVRLKEFNVTLRKCHSQLC